MTHFFKNDYFVAILHKFKVATFKIIMPAIVRLVGAQCNKIQKNNLSYSNKILKKKDPAAFERSLQELSKSARLINYILCTTFQKFQV